MGPKLSGSFTHNKLELALAWSFKWVNSFPHLVVEGCASEKCSTSHWAWVLPFSQVRIFQSCTEDARWWTATAHHRKIPFDSLKIVGPAWPSVFELPGCTRINSPGYVFFYLEPLLCKYLGAGICQAVVCPCHNEFTPKQVWMNTLRKIPWAVISNALLEPRYCTFKYSSTGSY